MSLHAWISLIVTLAVFAGLQHRRHLPADLLFLGGLVAVTLCGVITPTEALAGFANPAVLTIAALFVVAAGLRSTGVLDAIGNVLLGSARSIGSAIRRLVCVVLGISAFINNTPVVAMFVPVVLAWCRRRGVSPSRVLLPVSYVAIMGGTCTLIGTSTNIIVNGLLREEQQREARRVADVGREGLYAHLPGFEEQMGSMTLFEIGRVGFPCAVLGSAYLILIGYRLLPNRTELVEQLDEQRREYMVEMLVQPECRLIGKSVEQAGLRHLRGLFLIEIDRDNDVVTPVAPDDMIRAGDRLIFTGVVSTILDLVQIPGLVPATDITYEIHPKRRIGRHLSEAVVSGSSPLVGTTVRHANFRRLYNAAVVAVHRNGAQLRRKIGDIVLRAGDTLLLQTRTEFSSTFRNSRDFFLVADVEGSEPRRHERAWLAIALVVALIAWLFAGSWFQPQGLAAGFGSSAIAAVAIAGLMIVGRCIPAAEARGAIDLQVLVTIAAALGLGRALTESGAAEAIANTVVGSAGRNPYVLLIGFYALTVVFTELISNAAVAAMLFPLAVALAAAGEFSPRPFAMALALGASLSFITPIGYQTNLMVMGPGGYQPRDYLRAGLPLMLIVGAVALLLIPRVWPFGL
ncbi:MAG: SLC13 family permease [Thermoguttaceae bacterium]|jgi:di/tricarboxylate transporter|nr:SLC13 family permease [Thermoguttaceae bacterium]